MGAPASTSPRETLPESASGNTATIRRSSRGSRPRHGGSARGAGIDPLVPDRGRLGSLVRVVVAHFDGLRGEAITTAAGDLLIRRSTAILDGRVLPLTPTALAGLRMLADAQGAVVSRAKVLTALPGSSQDEHTAEVAVARLREATRAPGLIRILVKGGYRLDVIDS
jgi:uroporphyrinogen-III synthase